MPALELDEAHLGSGRAAHLEALAARRSGLSANDWTTTPLATAIGRVPGLESAPLPADWARWDCRNNRLAWLGLRQDGLFDSLLELRTRLPALRTLPSST